MTTPAPRTVFISWSGDLAKSIAEILQAWLPTLVDDIAPWASSVNIQAGSRWLYEVNSELDNADFGIVLVTLENRGAEWLNFEAGALGRRFAGESKGLKTLIGSAQVRSPKLLTL